MGPRYTQTVAVQLLLISDRDDDVKFAELLASTNGFDLVRRAAGEEVRAFLVERPQTVVLWNIDARDKIDGMSQILLKTVSPVRVFTLSDQPLSRYPEVFNHPAFGHNLLRRFEDPAPAIYAKLVAAAMTPYPLGTARFLPEGAKTQKIPLSRSSQKNAAVDALQSHFTKRGVIPRLAALAAQAVDELIMNAVFNAPVLQSGLQFRRNLNRAIDFDLSADERVEVEIGSSSKYFAVSVTDPHGSLQKPTLLRFLRRSYEKEGFVLKKSDPGSGLGIHGVIRAGLSLLFICRPKKKTQVTLFFPIAPDYRTFRSGFRFVSIMTES